MYVDDTIATSNDLSLIMDTESTLAQTFEMTLLSDIHFFLGNQIVRNCAKGCIFLSQSKYLIRLLKQYKMESINHIFTPLEASPTLTKDYCPTIETKHFLIEAIPHSNFVGSLMHVVIYSRPNYSYSIGWTLLNF